MKEFKKRNKQDKRMNVSRNWKKSAWRMKEFKKRNKKDKSASKNKKKSV
jgi:hypothetical protein